MSRRPNCRPIAECPELLPGSSDEVAALTEALHWMRPGTIWAAQRAGLLHFPKIAGATFWAVTDRTRRTVAVHPFSDPSRFTLFGDPALPVGAETAGSAVLFVRGSADLLAAFEHFGHVPAVAMLADVPIAPAELEAFRYRQVILADFHEQPGAEWFQVWRRQLFQVGAAVSNVTLPGWRFPDGRSATCLADVSAIERELAVSY